LGNLISDSDKEKYSQIDNVGNEFTMNSKQIFMMVAIIAALSVVMIVIPVTAQNMTGGNMTGGNMTGKVSSTNVEGTGCPVSAEGTPDGFCLQDKPQDEGQGEDDEEEQEGGN
jgi:hypothetical protein